MERKLLASCQLSLLESQTHEVVNIIANIYHQVEDTTRSQCHQLSPGFSLSPFILLFLLSFPKMLQPCLVCNTLEQKRMMSSRSLLMPWTMLQLRPLQWCMFSFPIFLRRRKIESYDSKHRNTTTCVTRSFRSAESIPVQ